MLVGGKETEYVVIMLPSSSSHIDRQNLFLGHSGLWNK